MGHSEGGVIAPMVAARCPDVAFIVLLAGTGLNGEQVLYTQGEAILKAMGAGAEELVEQKHLQELLFRIVTEEKDPAAAEGKIRKALADDKVLLEKKKKDGAEALDKAMEAQLKSVNSPWMRFFLAYDPVPALTKVRCPVLVLNGEKDVQVVAKQNTEAIEKALRTGGNKDFTIRVLPSLNHLFQTCSTGAVTEYARIEETMAPAALDAITEWMVKHTAHH
jgi:pimeloyl-ACP methyl ester carboxylesterase